MIRGKTRFLGVGEYTPPSGVGFEASIHNKFEIEVKDVTTGEVRQTGKAENIILDRYWTNANTTSTYVPGNYIAFGTGTGSISPDRTTMFNQLGRKRIPTASTTVVNNRAEKYSVFSGAIELQPSEYVGAELTEVGLSGEQGLATHALLKDANNNPISIVKTSTDLITIKASVYLHYPNADLKTTSLSYGVPDSSWGESILPVPRYALDSRGYHYISLGPGMSELGSNTAFDSANKKATSVFSRAQIAAQNDIPITGFSIGSGYVQLVPEEVYSDITNEVVGVGDGIKTGFSTYFPFPMNAVVKVDGVESTDVTVHQTYGTSFPSVSFHSFMYRIFSDGNLAPLIGSYNPGHIYFTSGTWASGVTRYYKNIFPEQGIYRISTANVPRDLELFISDDLEDWVSLGTASGFNIPEEYQNFRFFRITSLNSGNTRLFFSITLTDNIIFNTPPPEGAVIEVDYTFPGIAKDSNHVLDMEIEVSFGEHEE